MTGAAIAPAPADEVAHLDFEVVCNIDGCEHPADWWLVCLACAAHTPLCDPHRREEAQLVRFWGDRLSVACHHCRRAIDGSQWERQFTYVPIGRSS